MRIVQGHVLNIALLTVLLTSNYICVWQYVMAVHMHRKLQLELRWFVLVSLLVIHLKIYLVILTLDIVLPLQTALKIFMEM